MEKWDFAERAEFGKLISRLGQIGINVELGMGNCDDEKDFYLEMLQMYCEREKEKYKEIEKQYESGDWAGYTVRVHALKSTSLTIGAERFSKQAEEMEQAGKNRDAEYIRKNHGKMLWDYENICNRISDILGVSNAAREVVGIE